MIGRALGCQLRGFSRAQERGNAMYHTIEFSDELILDLEISPKHWLERTLISHGTRLQVQLKPYVVETEDGPIEVTDLYFADGTVARMVPFGSFTFVD